MATELDPRGRLRVETVRSGSWIAPEVGRVTFGTWVGEWRRTIVHLRPSTLASYDKELRLYIIPAFGRVPLAKLTSKDVRAWLAEMVAAGVPPSSVRRRFAVLRKVLNDAVAMEMLTKSPCRGVRPPADVKRDLTVLTVEEVRDLAEAMSPWFRTWVYVAAYTGLRWSEMMGLRRRDVDLLRRTVSVVQQSIEIDGRFVGYGPPKTAAGRRTIDLPAFLCEMLEDQLTRAQPGPDGLVFVNTVGKTPHVSSFSSQSWARARVAIGRPELHWHDLRHTAVALAIAQGAHPKAIQERMGHSSITVTLDRYGHLFPSLGVTIAEGLDAMHRAAPVPVAAAGVTALPTRRGAQQGPKEPNKSPKRGSTGGSGGQRRSPGKGA